MYVCMYVCMHVCICAWSSLSVEPGVVADHARGRINRENEFSYVRPSRPASASYFYTLRLNMVLTYDIPSAFLNGVHIYIYTVNRHHRDSPEFIESRNCACRWRILPRVRCHRTSKPQGSSSNGCCLCITMYQLKCASLSHTHY